jgi:hypothetical protein
MCRGDAADVGRVLRLVEIAFWRMCGGVASEDRKLA